MFYQSKSCYYQHKNKLLVLSLDRWFSASKNPRINGHLVLKSKQRRHIQRQIGNPIFDFVISGMNNIRNIQILTILSNAFIKWVGCISLRRFDLNWWNVVTTRHFGFRNQEVYFHSRFLISSTLAGKEEQLVSACSQHLCNDVFDDHSAIHF